MNNQGITCTGCKKGVKMCHTRPCLWTPEEFEVIINHCNEESLSKIRIETIKEFKPLKFTDEELKAMTSFDKLLLNLTELMTSEISAYRDIIGYEEIKYLAGGTVDDIFDEDGVRFMDMDNENSPKGSCAFLNTDESCSIHAIKPEQGRNACCKGSPYDTSIPNTHYFILWNSDKGKRVVNLYKEKVKYFKINKQKQQLIPNLL